MFRTVPPSIIRSFSLYTQQWYISHGFADSLRAGSGWDWFHPDPDCKLSANLLLYGFLVVEMVCGITSCQQTCMTYMVAVYTVKNS